jgi:hypothetical protein
MEKGETGGKLEKLFNPCQYGEGENATVIQA